MALKIISISGLDGSGKSTQAEMLIDYLTGKEKKTYYFHAVQFSIAQKILGNNKNDSKASAGVTKATSLSRVLRKVALMIDIRRFNRLIRRLEGNGYDYLVSDRYFYDTLINIRFLENRNDLPTTNMRKPDYSFLLDLEPKEIMKRERRPEQGVAYLKRKYKLYKDFAKKDYIKLIDASQSSQKIHESILSHIHD